jgi:ribosomal protein L37E
LDFRIAKCARCDKLFNKVVSEVCTNCQPEEDIDFSRIQDVLSRESHLNAEEVAAEAGVGLDCVLRMLREGRIDNISQENHATCGRCGAPAISTAKRLCQRCLVNLDRQRLVSKEGSDMNSVMEAVENRRASRRAQRRENERPTAPSPSPAPGRRMVMPEHLRKK